MRKIAFGYSTRCNIKCSHCVAADDTTKPLKMELTRAKEIITEMAGAGVSGISFTAGEPFIYFEDLLELVGLCSELNIYSRVVTNSFWASNKKMAEQKLVLLKKRGLCQLRLSFGRWHQQHVDRQNVVEAAHAALANGIDYFVSFVTDFSEIDDIHEDFLRSNKLKFFPEPVIYAGRADLIEQKAISTDYQENRCAMNPYLAPDLNMYACCDAGSHFTDTNFFLLGNLEQSSVQELFAKNESTPLYNCIRTMGITNIASFAGFRARDIISYRKCELCKKLFNSTEMLGNLQQSCQGGLTDWHR